jgi:predicted Rossmann-fold nucleotide-binding protein
LVGPVMLSPRDLYQPGELFAGFDAGRVGTYVDTLDARTYLATRLDKSEHAGAERALHDHAITVARDRLLHGRQVMAIMGGHGRARNEPDYLAVAKLSARLTNSGVLMASGGGPGIMEATHLGALCAPSNSVTEAIRQLSRSPQFPHGMAQLVPRGGDTFDADLIGLLHNWQTPAFRLLDSIPLAERGESLSIPTWFYGHEPPTPFATRIAKYFHNAIREDGLLAVAHDGIVYAPGSAGTIQEIFQDAAQNHYESFGRFSPMAFLDINEHWSRRFPIENILRPLFGDERYARWVRVTADPSEVFDFLLPG